MRLTHLAGRVASLSVASAALCFSVACGDQAPESSGVAKKVEANTEAAAKVMHDAADAARKDVAEAAETVKENVEQSAKIMKDTYDAEREAGANPLQAAGDAYNAVDAEPSKEEAEEQARKAAE